MKVSMKVFLMSSSLLMVSVVFNGCVKGKPRLEMRTSKGLEGENLRLNSLFFCNGDTGFIAGSSDRVDLNAVQNTNSFASVERSALLYRTTDGGKTWKVKEFGNGSFQSIIQAGKKIFAIKYSDESRRHHLYSTEDFGNSWQPDSLFPYGMNNLFFENGRYIAIGLDSGSLKTYIKISGDSGQTWRTFKSVTPILDVVLRGTDLIYLSSSKSNLNKKDLLVKHDLENNKDSSIILPSDFDCYFLNRYKERVKLVGLSHGYITIYSLAEDQSLTRGNSYLLGDSYFPQGYVNIEDRDIVIVGKRADMAVVNMILESNNKGISWEVIQFKKDTYIKPFCFITAEQHFKGWFYSGSGEFQVLN